MSNFSKGKIAIPSVTGNITINIIAEQSAIPITNLVDVYGIAENSRIKSNGTLDVFSGYCVVGSSNTDGLIPVSNGDVIRIKGAQWSDVEDTQEKIAFYNAETKASINAIPIYIGSTSYYTSCSYDAVNDVMTVTLSNLETRGYALLCLKGADAETLVITKNEEITP